MNWHVIIIAAICAIMLATYSMLSRHEEQLTDVQPTTPQPGFYMKDASIVAIGKDGNPGFTLHATTIQQDVTHQDVNLDQVKVDYLGTSQTPWTLTAQTGNLRQDSRTITFNDDVILQPTGPHVALPIILRTNQLSIDTARNLARATGKVSISMNQQLLTAVGMQADLQRQTIKLESQVHGEFSAH